MFQIHHYIQACLGLFSACGLLIVCVKQSMLLSIHVLLKFQTSPSSGRCQFMSRFSSAISDNAQLYITPLGRIGLPLFASKMITRFREKL